MDTSYAEHLMGSSIMDNGRITHGLPFTYFGQFQTHQGSNRPYSISYTDSLG